MFSKAIQHCEIQISGMAVPRTGIVIPPINLGERAKYLARQIMIYRVTSIPNIFFVYHIFIAKIHIGLVGGDIHAILAV